MVQKEVNKDKVISSAEHVPLSFWDLNAKIWPILFSVEVTNAGDELTYERCQVKGIYQCYFIMPSIGTIFMKDTTSVSCFYTCSSFNPSCEDWIDMEIRFLMMYLGLHDCAGTRSC